MKKILLWQFFTTNDIWLRKHIKEFILWFVKSKKIVFDPFAWNGDLLSVWLKLGFKKIRWFDIDKTLKWELNDSLLNIPKIKNSFIITNPPYLTNYSAKRKWLMNIEKYFKGYDDLYKVALEKILENNECGIVIIPETFINSSFDKSRFISITILEDNPFQDTDTPVCVVCFEKKKKHIKDIAIYKNDSYIWSLEYFENQRLNPKRKIKMHFNDLEWQIALRAIDMTSEDKQIIFMKREDLKYNLSWIKNSSRLITIIRVDINNKYSIDTIIKNANLYLYNYRKQTQDILFSPFKWNNNRGTRRRRIDYKSARAILEEVILSTYQLA